MKQIVEHFRGIISGVKCRYNPALGTVERQHPTTKVWRGVGTIHAGGYSRATIGNVQKPLHHHIYYLLHGSWPERGAIEHLGTGVKTRSDNRMVNLAMHDVSGNISRSQNINKSMHKRGRLPGYTRTRGRFEARISSNGVSLYIKSCDTAEEANLEYMRHYNDEGLVQDLIDRRIELMERRVHRLAKAVRCIETGVVYSAASLAALKNKIDLPGITRVCNQTRKSYGRGLGTARILTAGGFRWEYVAKGKKDGDT